MLINFRVKLESDDTVTSNDSAVTAEEATDSTLFTPQQCKLYEQRFQEGYDLCDPEYEAWIKIYHPVDVNSEPCDSSLKSESITSARSSFKACSSKSTPSEASSILSDLLVLPEPKTSKKRRQKKAINNQAVCITNIEVLEKMKFEEAAKIEEQKLKEEKKLERARKKVEREEKKKKKLLEREEMRREREEKRRNKELERMRKQDLKMKGNEGHEPRLTKSRGKQLHDLMETLRIESSASDDDSAICPKCGLVYPDDGGFWICCDVCNSWYNIECTGIKSKKQVPDIYCCEKCNV